MSQYKLAKTVFFGDLKTSTALYKYEIYCEEAELIYHAAIYSEQIIAAGKHTYPVWVRKDHMILKSPAHMLDKAVEACEDHWLKHYKA
ncbi:hypothetical protein AB8989_10125 [Yersinia hibernica]|uniref:Uncharacterized protein n=1 Tax=Yersinia hibernica TaxID=2339259 RepID=A0ABX5QZD4_9GAMM|nr:hypothetical protein [Yersinia hibernica]QAX78730.1 hypothetical protein D5F51_09260 [Yersinia hibernica]